MPALPAVPSSHPFRGPGSDGRHCSLLLALTAVRAPAQLRAGEGSEARRQLAGDLRRPHAEAGAAEQQVLEPRHGAVTQVSPDLGDSEVGAVEQGPELRLVPGLLAGGPGE